MGMVTRISRFEIFLVELDPPKGSEIKKTRPWVVISPNEINWNLQTVIIAPMTTKGNDYPTRIPIVFKEKSGQVVVDQIRTVAKPRLVKHVGKLTPTQAKQLVAMLQNMFA